MIEMKAYKLRKIGLLAALLTLFGACESWLDVKPKSQLKDTEQFSSENGFKKQLAGVYSGLTGETLYGKELTYGLLDVLAQVWDNTEGERYNYAKQYYYEDATTRLRIDSIWNGMYNAIANVNVLLDHIDGKEGLFTGHNYEIVKGEALALRGFLHFDLLRMFGASFAENAHKKAIPYVEHYSKEVYPQLTVSEVADKVIADLQSARDLLKNDPILTGREITVDDDGGYLMHRQVQMNYYAVTGLLARIYAYMGRLAEARPYAEEVVTSGKFPWAKQENLTGEDYTRDLTFASEHLFALNVIKLGTLANKYFKTVNGGYYFNVGGYRLEYFPNSADYRNYLFLADGKEFYAKYWQFSQAGINPYYQNKIPLIRLSEMYLILAESYVNEDPGKAAFYLDELTQARGLGKVSSAADFDIANEIFREYRREFLGEGQLFFYYKRKDQTNIPHASILPKSRNGYIFPLPDVEVEFGNRVSNR